jgi:hypothetical protein
MPHDSRPFAHLPGPPPLTPPRRPSSPSLPRLSENAPLPELRVAVHDRSRLEWIATVPVAAPGQTHTWDITMQADIPDAMWVPHQPWNHFQVRSRLTSPRLRPGQQLVGPQTDQLRRRTLAVVHGLKFETVRLQRALMAVRKRDGQLRSEEAEWIGEGLLRATLQAKQGRLELLDLAQQGALRREDDSQLAGDNRGDALALQREVALAVEFISNQIIMLVTQLTRALEGAPDRPKRKPLAGEALRLRTVLHQQLVDETQFRRAAGMRYPELHSNSAVDGYLQRAAQLKKHFQQAVFLEANAYMLDQRLRNWIAIAMAMVASTFYFVWQVWILNTATNAANTTFSLLVAGSIAALVYAAKDRIKEVGRDWLARRVKHGYADRVAHLSLQAHMDPKRSAFGLARETIDITSSLAPDLLNAELGNTHLVHHLHVRERLRHTGMQVLQQQGLVGLKHVFRYDLSPLLVKLDDQPKHVLLVDGGQLKTRKATRLYLIPVAVQMRLVGTDVVAEQRGYVRLRRRGLERFVAVRGPQTSPAATRITQPVAALN